MTTRIVVIGKDDKNKTTSPIERTLLEISQCMDKPIRLFVCTPRGTYEYSSGKHVPELQRTVTLVQNIFSTFARNQSNDCRLLLLDAVSISGEFCPISGLGIWLAAYHNRSSSSQTPSCIAIEKIIDFLSSDDSLSVVYWAGIVKHDRITTGKILKNRWGKAMGWIAHPQRTN